VHLQIVEDDDVACLQGGSELRLDVDVEGGPIHCAFEEPWGRQPMATQSGNEGLALPQWPNGTAPGSRSPFMARPRSRVSLVVVDVSSMKTSRCGMARMIGWRLWIQTLRALATSERARSSASRVSS
jgi:hypothetical protein